MAIAYSRRHTASDIASELPSMKILVTGSSGHLGEALVRTLREQAHEVVALDILESPFTTAGRLDLGPRLRPALHGGRGRGAARGHPAQAARRHPQPAGFRRHQRHRHAQPAGGGGGGRRPVVRLHQHDQRVRRRAGAAGGRAGGMGDRRRRAGAEEHLRRHEGGGRGPVRAVPPQPAPARASCCGRRASSPRRTTTGRVRDAYADDNAKANEFLHRRVDVEDVVGAHLLAARASAGARLRALHHQRDHAVLAATIWRSCATDAPAVVAPLVPALRGGVCAPRLDDVAEHRPRLRQRAGAHELGWRPRYDFALAIERLAAGQDFRSPLARVVGAQRAIMRRHSPKGRILWS